jgi:hypothetical protein
VTSASATTPRGIAVAILAALVAAGCTAPVQAPEGAREGCRDFDQEIVQLAWSQTGTFLAVGTIDAEGQPWARVVRADNPGPDVDEARSWAGMLAGTVVVRADGQLAWVAETDVGRQLIEDAPDGRATGLPDDVTAIAWTAIGFALLQRPPEGGSRILLLDVDRPAAPTVLHETDRAVERLWIPADPEVMLLTIVHPDHRDAPPSYEVVRSAATQQLEPPGADTSGASMPALRRSVVYRSAITGRMQAVNVGEPGVPPTVLSERAATRGAVSDHGLLALAAAERPGRLCLIDVAALLP